MNNKKQMEFQKHETIFKEWLISEGFVSCVSDADKFLMYLVDEEQRDSLYKQFIDENVNI